MAKTAASDTHLVIEIDKRLTIGAVIAAAVIVFGFGGWAATAQSRLTALEAAQPPLAAKLDVVNERTIRIEERVGAIGDRLGVTPPKR